MILYKKTVSLGRNKVRKERRKTIPKKERQNIKEKQ
jgi:hypothetical protein